MELGSVFLILAVLLITGTYLYSPFTKKIRNIYNREAHEISALKAERDRVINSLQELDFDFKLGKIPAEDYPEQRTALLQKGAAVLRKLDELETDLTPSPLSSRKGALKKRGESEEARIEKAIAVKQADSSSLDTDFDHDEIEVLIAERRKHNKNKSAGFCPKCGKPILVTDKFCPLCGKAL